MNLRKHERIPVDYAGSFVGEYLRGKGVILDLSIGGCRVSSPSIVTTGDKLGVLIELPFREPSLYITRTVVRWTTATEFGMEFILMDLEDRHRLDQMVLKTGPLVCRALDTTNPLVSIRERIG